jgi:hypothetical protein
LPKGLKGEKRPADAISAKTMRIKTGDGTENVDTPESKGKGVHASAMGAAARMKKAQPEAPV